MELTKRQLEGAMKLGSMNPVVETQEFSLDIIWNDMLVVGAHKNLTFFEHSHTFTELYFVLGGSVNLLAGEREITLFSGDCLIIPAGLSHRIIRGSDDFCRYDIGFRVRKGDALKNALATLKNEPATAKITEATEHAIRYMLDSAASMQLCAQSCIDAMMTCCIVELFCQILPAPTVRNGEQNGKKSALAHRISDYIRMNYTSPLTAESVACEFHMSLRQISRVLKSYDNTGVAELLLSSRIDAARELLQSSPLSVDEISQRVGYSNEYTFIRAFRRCMGVTPGQFRRRN